MTNTKRGRGSHRGVYFCAVAALGLALSACGGAGSSGAASAPSSAATQSSPPTTPVGSGASTSTDPPAASAGALNINWTPPTENTDGTPLTNLAGYNIHYGTAPGHYTQMITVANPGIASYVVQNLGPGTYYFAVAAVNSTGTESPLSSQVSATVN
jgi:hypothetical protein